MKFEKLPTSDYPELSSALQDTDKNRREVQSSLDLLRHLKHMLLAFASRFHAVVDTMTLQSGVIEIHGRKGDAPRLQEAVHYQNEVQAFDDLFVDPIAISHLIEEGTLAIAEEDLKLDQVLNGFFHRIALRISLEAAILNRELSPGPWTVTVPMDDVFYMIQRGPYQRSVAIKTELLKALSSLLPDLQVLGVDINTMTVHPNEIEITVQTKEKPLN